MRDYIENKLSETYKMTRENNKAVFHFSGGTFEIDTIGAAFVISYSDGEDGDRFYQDDYSSLDDMVAAMIDEVEN